MARFKAVQMPGLPAFTGGAIGYIAYEAVRHYEPRVVPPEADVLGIPEAMFLFCDSMVVFDHIHHTIKVIAHCRLDGDIDSSYRQAAFQIDEIVDRLNRPTITLPLQAVGAVLRANGKAESNVGREGYELMVERIREYVIAGDVIQAVPSQRLPPHASTPSHYRQLRREPCHHVHLDLGLQVFGGLSRVVVRVEDGVVSTQRSAGTRGRVNPRRGLQPRRRAHGRKKERASTSVVESGE